MVSFFIKMSSRDVIVNLLHRDVYLLSQDLNKFEVSLLIYLLLFLIK